MTLLCMLHLHLWNLPCLEAMVKVNTDIGVFFSHLDY
jgi:hypothetical protein